MENLPNTQMPEERKTQWVKGAATPPPIVDPLPKRQPIPVKRESTIASILWAVGLALLIRIFLFEPFNIPSTSMVPNLLVGDYLFVSKFSYGYSAKSIGYGANFDGRILASHLPQRGDVVVFKLPTDTTIDYIKRVIGLPGDRIQMIHGVLNINGVPVERRPLGAFHYHDENRDADFQKYDEVLPNNVHHTIIEETDDGPLDNTTEYTVPPGHYFMMGDNRDNSQDSRVMSKVGFVPYENIVGRAEIIFFSLGDDTPAWAVWKWPFAIRYGRLLDIIH